MRMYCLPTILTLSLPGTRVLVFPGGTVSYNKFVHNYCEKAKPLMRGLMEHANMVFILFLVMVKFFSETCLILTLNQHLLHCITWLFDFELLKSVIPAIHLALCISEKWTAAKKGCN